MTNVIPMLSAQMVVAVTPAHVKMDGREMGGRARVRPCRDCTKFSPIINCLLTIFFNTRSPIMIKVFNMDLLVDY